MLHPVRPPGGRGRVFPNHPHGVIDLEAYWYILKIYSERMNLWENMEEGHERISAS